MLRRPTKRQRQIRREDDVRSRHFIRTIGEWRYYLGVSVVVDLLFVQNRKIIEDLPYLMVLPLGLTALAFYKYYFPTEPANGDNLTLSGKRPRGSNEDASPDGGASTDLKSALGPAAQSLHEIEKRLLDNMATSRVAGPGLVGAMRKFSLTRSRLIARTKTARRKSDRKTGRHRGPRSE